MTTRKKGSFSAKGKTILDEKPTALGDILDADTSSENAPIPTPSTENKKTVNTENRINGSTETQKNRDTVKQKPVKPETRKTVNTVQRKTSNTEKITEDEKLPTKREEFRLPADLAERLRVYAFDIRSKKTVVVIDALDAFLKKEGY